MNARTWSIAFAIAAWLATVLSLLAVALVMPRLPSTIPSHVGWDGTSSGAMPSAMLFFGPGVLAVVMVALKMQQTHTIKRYGASGMAAIWASFAGAAVLVGYAIWTVIRAATSAGPIPFSAADSVLIASLTVIILGGAAVATYSVYRQRGQSG